MRETAAVDAKIAPTLRAVAKRQSYFTKREAVVEVLRRAALLDVIKDARGRYPGADADLMILSYIEHAVGVALRARDSSGLRRYECYNAGNGERRWRRLRDMRAPDLRQVVLEAVALRDQLEEKIHVYEACLMEMERRGPEATVGEVLDVVSRRVQMRSRRRSA